MHTGVHVENLSKRYGSTTAVDGVSFDVQPGEIFGLLGPNGAGKTTAIECVLGIRRPDSGQVTIGGFDSARDGEAIKQIIGAQLQATALQDKLTPRAALKFFASFYRKSLPAEQLLPRFGLTEKADQTFDTLSTGQRQRLALALAFVNDPAVLFLDEPTAGLDPHVRRELHGDIRQFKTDGRAVLLSTHYIEEAYELCDRVAILNAGRIVAMGKPDELLQRASIATRVLVQTDPPLAVDSIPLSDWFIKAEQVEQQLAISTDNLNRCVLELMRWIDSRGLPLVDLRIARPTLEEAYLEITGKTE